MPNVEWQMANVRLECHLRNVISVIYVCKRNDIELHLSVCIMLKINKMWSSCASMWEDNLGLNRHYDISAKVSAWNCCIFYLYFLNSKSNLMFICL